MSEAKRPYVRLFPDNPLIVVRRDGDVRWAAAGKDPAEAHVFAGELNRLAAEVERLRTAVEYYAEQRNYRDPGASNADAYKWLCESDGWDIGMPGARARAALKGGQRSSAPKTTDPAGA